MMAFQEMMVKPEFTLRDFMRLYLLDPDLKLLFRREVNGVESLTTLELLPDESIKIKQEVCCGLARR